MLLLFFLHQYYYWLSKHSYQSYSYISHFTWYIRSSPLPSNWLPPNWPHLQQRILSKWKHTHQQTQQQQVNMITCRRITVIGFGLSVCLSVCIQIFSSEDSNRFQTLTNPNPFSLWQW
jgi:hypothetical protein